MKNHIWTARGPSNSHGEIAPADNKTSDEFLVGLIKEYLLSMEVLRAALSKSSRKAIPADKPAEQR